MQLKLNQLDAHLRDSLAPVYFVSGDETLLVQEACEAIVAAAQARGFDERTVVDGVNGIDWNEVLADAASLSLFSQRRLLDVRVTVKAFDRAGSDALRRYLDAPFEDTVLLVRTGRLDPRQRSSAWFKAMDARGAVLLVWPIGARELPRWLDGRCKAAGMRLERDAVLLLADRVEGNLLAAVQEIEKLKLLDLPQPVDAEALRAAVGDASHFDTFELIDAALGGRPERVRKMLRVLRQEGVAVYLIMGAVTSQLRRALNIATGGRERMAPQRLRMIEALVARLGRDALEALIAESALLDLQAKGMLRGDAWQSLERLLLKMAGRSAPSLEDEARYLSNR